MQKVIKYTIFKTRWGYFGLAGTEFAILRTHLPDPEPEKIKHELLKNLSFVNRDSRIEHQESRIEFDKTFFKTTQEQITAYFEGSYVNFSHDIPITLDDCTSICHSRTFCHSRESLSSTPIGGGNPQTITAGKCNSNLKLDKLSPFAIQVLTACRDIKFGQTISYSGLAKKLGRPGTARAVGGALAKNPLPLIIPCHRVIHSDGKIGGFSTPGGTNLKAKLLELEQQVIRNRKSD